MTLTNGAKNSCVVEKTFLRCRSVAQQEDDREAAADGRVNTQVNLTPAAREYLDKIKTRFNVNKQAAVEHIIEWISVQDDAFVSALLTKTGDPNEVLVRLRLSRRGVEQAALTVADLARQGHDIIAQLETMAGAAEKELRKRIQRRK